MHHKVPAPRRRLGLSRDSSPMMALGEALATLEECRMWAAEDALATLESDPTIDTAAQLAHAINETRAALALTADVLAEFLLDTAGRGRCDTADGVPPFEVRVGRDRKQWDHARVWGDLLDPIAASLPLVGGVTGDGERVEAVDVVRLVVDAVRGVQSDAWKVTGLRALGLDPDEYAETSRGRVTVTFL